MEPSKNNLMKGELNEVKGAVKEAAGKLTGDGDLEAEGTVQKAKGQVQQKIGQIEEILEK